MYFSRTDYFLLFQPHPRRKCITLLFDTVIHFLTPRIAVSAADNNFNAPPHGNNIHSAIHTN